jgi:chromosome segregation ATPase
LSYNYWILSQKALYLKENLFIDEEKLTIISETKVSLEKQNEIYSSKIKQLQEDAETISSSISKKDSELDELNSKVKTLNEENAKNFLEITELKKINGDCGTKENTLNGQMAELKKKYEALESSVKSMTTVPPPIAENCENKLEAYKKSLTDLAAIQDKNFGQKLKLFLADPSKVAQSGKTTDQDDETEVILKPTSELLKEP